MTELRRVRLAEIARQVGPLATLGVLEGIEVTDVVFDHREVTPGALFCCLVGAHHDGHRFAGAARAAGAAAFICEHSLGSEVGGAAQLVVPPGTARVAMARAAGAFYGHPATSMKTVGVTGTNGKTTTTLLLRSIFERAGWPSGVIGTLDSARTTPESPHLQSMLAGFRDNGFVASALEVTSHTLVQHRVDGIVFDVAVFTNLTQDHLDFHETMDAYFDAKAILFEPDHARLGVVNGDDAYGRRLLERQGIPTVSFSLEDVRELEVGVQASRFRLGGRLVNLPIGAAFNVYNALAAAAAARALGVGTAEIIAGLEAAPPVPGRFETIDAGNGVMAVIDFAHTPAGLGEVLRAARQAIRPSGAPGRVIVVFGCGGDRDRGKRPAMGAIAGALADFVVLTSDNPRSEDPRTIIEEIRAGLVCSTPYEIEEDRRRAISFALGAAQPGDVVVVAGKGHETTQQFADRSIHFDDREVVRDEILLEHWRRENRARPTEPPV